MDDSISDMEMCHFFEVGSGYVYSMRQSDGTIMILDEKNEDSRNDQLRNMTIKEDLDMKPEEWNELKTLIDSYCNN